MTGDTPLTDLTIAEASERIHAGELSPLLLTEAYLKRIEELNPTLNAFLTVLADDAHHEAAHATVAIARGQDWGPLHGIPVALRVCPVAPHCFACFWVNLPISLALS